MCTETDTYALNIEVKRTSIFLLFESIFFLPKNKLMLQIAKRTPNLSLVTNTFKKMHTNFCY